MGEAKDIVGSPKSEHKAPRKRTLDDVRIPGTRAAKAGVIAVLTDVIDDLDRAIQVKQNDLSMEGHGMVPENHYKLGILKGADSLVRRARAMLQDYGLDLDEIGITEDPKAVKGEEIEAHSDMAHFHSTKKGHCTDCTKDNVDLCDDCDLCQDCCYCHEAEEADDPGDKGGKC